ncbi:MAG: cytochrome d ubiquinol oxidase subunit II [Tuberibacillus sp.]
MSVGFVLTMLWVYLYCYLILASIDFGAGIYAYYGLVEKDTKSVAVLRHFLSPIWDIIHMVLLMFIFIITSFLPLVMKDFGEPLKIPAIIILFILFIRTIAFALKRNALGKNRLFTFMYGLTGVIIAIVLSTVLTLSEGGYLEVYGDVIRLKVSYLFSSFYFWSVVILAVVSLFYISAIYLIFLSYKMKKMEALEKFRALALAWCVPTLLASALVFVALQRHNPEHFNRILDLSWLFLLSLVSYFIAVTLVFVNRHYALAFFFVLCQFFFAFYGYGWSHLPYILYPYIEVHPFNSWKIGALSSMLALLLSLTVTALILRVRRLTIGIKAEKNIE